MLAAGELGIPSGGTAPRGWLTENGPREALLRSFNLIECVEDGYAARTRINVANSDGTLLVGDYHSGGSQMTWVVARQLSKPLYLLSIPSPPIPPENELQRFRRWLERHDVQVLNVAGNRESQSPGIAEFTRLFLVAALRQ